MENEKKTKKLIKANAKLFKGLNWDVVEKELATTKLPQLKNS